MRSFAVASFFNFFSSSSFSLEIQEESPAFGLPSAPARRREVGGDGLPITRKAGCLLHFFGGAVLCTRLLPLRSPMAYRRKQGAADAADDRRSSYPQARTPAPLSLSPASRAPLPYHFLMVADSELTLPESNMIT